MLKYSERSRLINNNLSLYYEEGERTVGQSQFISLKIACRVI